MTTTEGLVNHAEAVPTAHPLDPISAAEVDAVREALTAAGKIGETTRFASVQLHEPHKREVLAFSEGDPIDRRAVVVLLDIAQGDVHEAVVSATTGEVVSIERIPTETHPYGQPAVIMEEFERIDVAVKSDARWQRAVAERGFLDHDKLIILPLAPGYFGFENEKGKRIMRAFTLFREKQTDSPWANPLEGLIAYVDLTAAKVVELFDYGVVPLPSEHGNFREGDWGPSRTDLKPLEIVQPEGPSFSVDGRLVEWQNWRFRVGFDQREGLVLHQLSFRDGDRDRPIMYRGSLSEMVVPYADPNPMRFWINYFDIGEYGLGKLTTSLQNGCDCLGEIHYFDAVLADDNGVPYTAKNVVCLHEEDYGVLWKHAELYDDMHDETRRSRRLVISFWTAIGNYDYGFFWYLYQDGTIEYEAKLTGIVFANAQLEGTENPYATQIAPGLAAPYHQHLFNVRLDMTVDGVANTVEEQEVVRLPRSDENPYGNAFTVQSTPITSESDAGRLADPLISRTWKVVNPESTNRLGQPASYKLVPHASPVLLAAEEATVRDRAAFATKHLWVTQYDPAERYASGEYPNQHAGGAGIPAFQAAERNLVQEDVVLWHTFGTTHIPRTEDWPIMPVEYAGFTLKPVNFFERNPTLDLPKPTPKNHCAHGATCTCDHDHS